MVTKRPVLYRPYTLEDARRDAEDAGMGVPTGFPELERVDFRWHPGRLSVIAGRPGEGKTTLMLNFLMRHVEERHHRLRPSPAASFHDTRRSTPSSEEDELWAEVRGPAIYVAYEESLFQTYAKLLARQAALHRIRNGGQAGAPPRREIDRFLAKGSVNPGGNAAVWQDELERAAGVIDFYAEHGLLALVDGDRIGGDIDQLLGSLAAAMREAGEPAGVIFIDYFQKIRPPADLRLSPRQIQLQVISELLRRFAKGDIGSDPGARWAVPVVVGAQVNRDACKGQPELENIREADDLANDASGVITLYRPKEEPRTMQCKLVKHRTGKRDEVLTLDFAGEAGLIHSPGADEPSAKSMGRLVVAGVI